MIRSFGLGFIFIPVSVLALSDLPDDQRGNGTGLFNLTRELGGSIGTALMGMLVTDGIKRNASHLSESVTVYNPIAQEQMRAMSGSVGSQTFTRGGVAEGVMAMKVSREAMVLSFEQGFRFVAFAMLLGVILVLLLKRPKSVAAVSGAH
jgi:DHA2 family multidrug resistance protein